MSVDQIGLMPIFVQLLHIRYLICLPTYLPIISLPRACSFQNQIFLSVSCIATCSIMVSEAQAGWSKALLGTGGSDLVLLPVLICSFACLAFRTAAQERTGDGGLVRE